MRKVTVSLRTRGQIFSPCRSRQWNATCASVEMFSCVALCSVSVENTWVRLVVEGTCVRGILTLTGTLQKLEPQSVGDVCVCVCVCVLGHCWVVCSSVYPIVSWSVTPFVPYTALYCLLKLNLYRSVFLFTTLSLLRLWVSLSSVKSVYDPILVLSQSLKIEVWFVQQRHTGGRGRV